MLGFAGTSFCPCYNTRTQLGWLVRPDTAGRRTSSSDKESLKKTATVVSTIVVACFATILGLIGWIGHNSYAPKIIDQLFGLSNYIQKIEDDRVQAALTQFRKRVDSGYSATFVFSKKADGGIGTGKIMFSAASGQTAKLTVHAYSIGAPGITVRILVDDLPWSEPREVPFTFVGLPITQALRSDIDPGGDSHFVRIVPTNPMDIAKLPSDAAVIADCIVIVSNEPQ